MGRRIKTEDDVFYVIGWALLAAAGLIALIWYIFKLPLPSDCAFHAATGIYCPGCGGTRAVKYLLQGKVFHSLLAHPVPVYVMVILVRIWIALGHNLIVGREMVVEDKNRTSSERKIWPVFCHWEMWFILIVVFGFFILRDVALVIFKWDFLGDLAQFW